MGGYRRAGRNGDREHRRGGNEAMFQLPNSDPLGNKEDIAASEGQEREIAVRSTGVFVGFYTMTAT